MFLHTLLSLRHCSTVPPHFTITVPLFHCSFTLNYHCFTAPLFQHSLLQLWSPCAMTICSNYTRTHRCNKTCWQWTAILSGSVLRSLVCTWQFWRREWDLKGYFTAEKWKTFLNKNHTTSQDCQKSLTWHQISSKHRKRSEVFSGNWLRGVYRTARILYGLWSDRLETEESRPVN